MSRLAIVLLAAMAWAGTATAQTQSTAPTAHAGTKLAFPASVGGAQLERSVNYAGPPSNRPDQEHYLFVHAIRNTQQLASVGKTYYNFILGGTVIAEVFQECRCSGAASRCVHDKIGGDRAFLVAFA